MNETDSPSVSGAFPATPPAIAANNAALMLSKRPKPAAVGDIWHRVDGSHLGDEVYEGMELSWTTWRCEKVTKCGAWFVCTEWRARDRVFAATSGARNLHRTDVEALNALIARKRRQLVILNSQTVAAQDTLGIARETLPKLEAYRASGRYRP